MSNHILQTIEELKGDLHKQEAEVADTKRLINKLCARANVPLMYPDPEPNAGDGASLSIRGDQFYGQPLATCMRTILEMRRALNQGPATVNDLYAALKAGGYKFETTDEQNAKRGLRISLMKNTGMFHKLPTGTFGMTEWYPAIKRREAPAARDEEPTAAPTTEPTEATGGEP